jgi:hypothetical protein
MWGEGRRWGGKKGEEEWRGAEDEGGSGEGREKREDEEGDGE